MIVRAGHRRTVDFGDRGMVKSFVSAHDEGALQTIIEAALQNQSHVIEVAVDDLVEILVENIYVLARTFLFFSRTQI